MRCIQLVFITGVLLFIPSSILASGAVATNIFTQVITTESRAVIVYDQGVETIFDSITFNVNPVTAWNFAVVYAVPSKPTVELVLDETITRFEALSDKKLDKSNIINKILYFDIEEQEAVPTNLYTRPIDFTKFEIFAPKKNLDDLHNYLAESGYFLPKESNHLLKAYQQKDWYFIVAEVNTNHLQTEARESLTVPGAHTYPIKIQFKTDRIVYPLTLAKIQPDYDSESDSLSYEYGSTSTQVLGQQDLRVDDMLSSQSKNKFPRIPLDYGYHKVELFVLAANKVEAPTYITLFASKLTSKNLEFKNLEGITYYQLPQDRMFLTRLYTFKPMVQLEDVYLTPTSNKPVNVTPTLNQIIKLAGFNILILFLIKQLNKLSIHGH